MMQQSAGAELLGPLAADLAVAALALARRFSNGATLWCWAPGAPEHAQHVAVEFVHPVIIGTRALPAIAVTSVGGVDDLRAVVRRGDVILIVGAVADHGLDSGVAAVLRRGASWGVTTFWIGAGARPPAGAADHVLWRDVPACAPGDAAAATGGADAALAAFDGRLVLVYHLLWELTHVCLEHPGLLTDDSACSGPTCVTCADEADVAEVVEATPRHATVRTDGRLAQIDTSLIDDVSAGDLVLVHAGAAISIVDEARTR
jgi:hydrogenase maturation factor